MAAKLVILLDTSTLFWSALDPGQLSATARDVLLDKRIARKISLISAWEIQIKHALGKMNIPDRADRFVRGGATALHAEIVSPTLEDIAVLYNLPNVHRDPFDRILVAQAISSKWTILSPDQALRHYPVQVLW
jgi:PIN domain nuclease of toxin-antitoxin system